MYLLTNPEDRVSHDKAHMILFMRNLFLEIKLKIIIAKLKTRD